MANMNDCLQVAMDNGEVDLRKGKDGQAAFTELVDRYKASMPEHAAEARAAADLKEATKRSANSRAHAVIEQLKTAQRNQARYGGPDATPRLLIEDLTNVGMERAGLMRQIHGQIGDFLKTHAPDLLGNIREKALLMDVVRELHGEKTGSASAKLMAKAIQKAQTRLRTLFNAHGGDIGELADFGIPHTHDVTKLRKAGFQAWRDTVFDKLDWNRITDVKTGKPFALGGRPNRAAADRFLQEVYDGIVSRGWNKREASFAPGGKSLFNQRADARVLHFKSADEWMQYNEMFGSANPFDSILGHLDGLARDIALMRNFGPNPQAGLDHALQVLEKQANLTLDDRFSKALDRVAPRAKTMMAHLDGSANRPVDEAWASGMAGTRQYLVSAQLGSTVFTAITDIATVRMAAKAMGANPKNAVSNLVRLLSSKKFRSEAASAGYVADTLSDAMVGHARYMGDVWSPAWTKRISGFVLRASGLNFWTDMIRIAFQMETAGHIARQVGKKFEDINPLLLTRLKKSGFTADDWSKIADPAALFTAPDGSKFLNTKYWLETTSLPRAEAEGLAIRLQAVFETQLEMAIPSVSLEGRSAVLGESRPGTLHGEALRSILLYKNYPISLMINQYRHISSLETKTARALYFANLAGGLTIMAALSNQLQEIIKGRDPRPMDNVKFWGAAFVKGGGLGILGDFISSSTSRAGGGFAETLAGPVVGLAADAGRLVFSNASAALNGKPTHVGRDVANIIRKDNPFASFAPTRTALDRMVMDNIQRFLDPDAEKYFRQAEKRQQREYGNASWWARGNMLPRRAPDLSNAVGANR